MNRVFISYVIENETEIKRLGEALKSRGIEVWSPEDILAGKNWKAEIRRTIEQARVFIACFSKQYYSRDRTFMREELEQAISELRLRPDEKVWFIPVKLDDCEIPDTYIRPDTTLRQLQYVSLYEENWNAGIDSIVKSIRSVLEPDPLKLFIAYAHQDLEARDELITHLGSLQSEGLIGIWHDNEILNENSWRDPTFRALSDSGILLYLVSASSLASANCNEELGVVLEEEIMPIPVILEACEWPYHQLSHLQVLPKEGKPINEYQSTDAGWESVKEGIRETIIKIQFQADGLSEISEEELRAKLAFQRGNLLVILGQVGMAIKAYSDAIDFSPDYAVRNNRGDAYTLKGELDQAILDYDMAIELEPRLAKAYCGRGYAKRLLNRCEEAITDYDEALQLNPNYVECYTERGLAKRRLLQYEAALADYNKAIRLKPDYAEGYYSRGGLKNHLSFDVLDHDRVIHLKEAALADYDEAIRLKPDYVGAYNDRGNVKRRLPGRDEEALADYTEAIRIKPDFVDAYANRAELWVELDRVDDAIADSERALELAEEQGRKDIKIMIAKWRVEIPASAVTRFDTDPVTTNEDDEDN